MLSKLKKIGLIPREKLSLTIPRTGVRIHHSFIEIFERP